MIQPKAFFEIGKFATKIAYVSFGIGTLLFIAERCFTKDEHLIIAGIFFIILALLVNSCTMLALLYHFYVQKKYREYYAVKMLLLLANIPIAVLYFYIIINNFTITFF